MKKKNTLSYQQITMKIFMTLQYYSLKSIILNNLMIMFD